MEFIRELMITESKRNSSGYELYHNSYSSAIREALDFASSNGYSVDDDEVFSKIGSGPRKPQPGNTNRFSLSLTKNGRPVREALHLQVYNMGDDRRSSPYELNVYIA